MSHTHPPRTLESFDSDGRPVRLETFGAADDETMPSILVLHGATGVEHANRFIAGLAQSFARQGFVAHLVHYFDRTGTTYADDEAIRASADDWVQTVHDAVAFVRRLRPGAALGLFGYSLGGYLTAAESTTNDDIAAAVVLAGGLDDKTALKVRRAAPTLILHGDADTRVPLSEGRKLEAALKRAGRAPQVHVYPGEGHLMSLPAYADVVRRGSDFFRAELRHG